MKNRLWVTVLITFLVIGIFPLNGQQRIFNKVEVDENDVQDNVVTFGGDILIKLQGEGSECLALVIFPVLVHFVGLDRRRIIGDGAQNPDAGHPGLGV